MGKFNKDVNLRHKWLVKLTDVEEAALSLLRPFDVATIKPVARQFPPGLGQTIWNYFRVVISSAPQVQIPDGMGRNSYWGLFDETSGALLGIWSYSDVDLPWGRFSAWAGGHVGGKSVPMANHVIQLKRCLPVFEFGDLTGGKLMVLAATATETLEVAEMRHSFKIMCMIVNTLHGKSSQYNRLHTRGLLYEGTGENGKGLYIQSFYEHARDFLRMARPDPGARLTYSFQEQVDYWKERWLPNRVAEHTKDGWVVPNVETYRLSSQIRHRLSMHNLVEPTHD